MRRLKMVIPIGLLAMTGVLTAQPVEAPTVEEKARKRTDKMVEHLDLSDDQATQVHQLNVDGATEMEPYVQRLREAEEALDKARKQAVESRTAQLKTILTDEQFAKLEQKRAEREQRLKAHRAHCRPGRTGKPLPDKR